MSATQRITWSGPLRRTAKFNGHHLKVTEAFGNFFGHFNRRKIGPYTTEVGAKNALRRRAMAPLPGVCSN